MEADADVPMPGSLTFQPPKTPAPSTPFTRLDVPSKPIEPFIFGSPLPQHNVSNAQFKSAATNVLEEMNKRLQVDGVQGVGMEIIGKLQPGAHADGVKPLVDREMKHMPKGSGMTEKFEKMHEEEFKKMEGIDGFSRRRGISPKKSGGNGAGRDRFGRRVGGAPAGRLSEKIIANGKKPRVLPGSFDNEDDDEDNDHGKMEEKIGGGHEANEDKEREDAEREKEEERKRKEREAIKRKLELNKARRKSSVGVAGRVSVGRGGVLRKFGCFSILSSS